MDSNLPAPIEPDDEDTDTDTDTATDTEIEIVTIPDEFGAVVIGNERDLAEFAQRWQKADGKGTVTTVSASDIQKLTQIAPQLIGTAKTVRYVLGPALRRQANGPAPGTIVTYHRMTRSASTGKILANPRIGTPTGFVGAGGAPPMMLALASIEIALNQLAERIEARLDVIEDKVDEILRLASAQRLGDVYGHVRLLKRRLNEVSNGNHLTDTDWSSIASLGTDLEVGVERLRQHALQLLATLRTEDPADKRAETLKSVVEKGRLSETLQLLLVAQQSLYIWQRLRLERVNSAEHDFLPQTVESARTTLREQLDADRDLADQLRSTLAKPGCTDWVAVWGGS